MEMTLFLSGVHKSARQEMVNDGNSSSNDKDNVMPHPGHQSDGDASSNSEDDHEDEEYTWPGVTMHFLCMVKGRGGRHSTWYVATKDFPT
jgi:hypothetical protein